MKSPFHHDMYREWCDAIDEKRNNDPNGVLKNPLFFAVIRLNIFIYILGPRYSRHCELVDVA